MQKTHLVTRRFVEIVFPSKTVQYVLMLDDRLERDADTLRVLFANGNQSEIFLGTALAINQETVTREEPFKPTPAKLDWFGEAPASVQ